MNPVGLPTGRHPDQLVERCLTPRGRGARLCLQNPLVISRHHLDEQRLERLEAVENARAELAAGVLDMPYDQATYQLDVLRILERFQIDHVRVATLLKVV